MQAHGSMNRAEATAWRGAVEAVYATLDGLPARLGDQHPRRDELRARCGNAGFAFAASVEDTMDADELGEALEQLVEPELENELDEAEAEDLAKRWLQQDRDGFVVMARACSQVLAETVETGHPARPQWRAILRFFMQNAGLSR